MKDKSMTAYNLLYYKPKLWEEIILWFCPLKTHEAPTCVIWYKTFSNRMYIYGYMRAQTVDRDTYTTGSNYTPPSEGNSTHGYDNAGNN